MSQFDGSGSPYLQLFAGSKVDWQDYSDLLLPNARKAKKAIHLSIGSFLSPRARLEQRFYEREDVAETLNNYFINVKVDADEHPELDWFFKTIYTSANQILIGQRFDRFPLSIYIDPIGERVSQPTWHFPFDPYSRSEGDIALWHRNILSQHLQAASVSANEQATMLFQLTRKRIETDLDRRATGSFEVYFERAEVRRKHYIEAFEKDAISMRQFLDVIAPDLLRLWYLSENRTGEVTKGLDVLLVELTRWVRDVGFDHVKGGFFTPQSNRDPLGFEVCKTLALNAWSLKLLSQAVAISHDRLLSEALEQTANFIVGELANVNGGFHAGVLDGENSLEWGWTRRELQRSLTEDEYLVIETLYGLDKRANWNGRWMLRRVTSWRSVVDQLFFSTDESESLLQSALAKMKSMTDERKELLIDERLLVGPNAMAASALLLASKVTDNLVWANLAMDSVHSLIRAYKLTGEGRQRELSLIERALLLDACLDVLEYQWDDDVASLISLLVEGVRNRIRDESRSLTRNTAELESLLVRLPLRPELGKDHPVDSVRRSLQRYATLYQDSGVMNELSSMFADMEALSAALQYGSNPSEGFILDFFKGETTVVLRGPESETGEWRNVLTEHFRPWRHLYVIPYSSARDLPNYLPRIMGIEDRDRVMAFVLQDLHVQGPFHELEEVKLVANS